MMILIVIISYLLGSISFSFLIGKYWAGIDIRKFGSGNAGATNTLRVLGIIPGIIVLLLDGLKGAIAVLFAQQLTHSPLITILSGICVIVGHNWPIFLNFKGGKGVATTIGVVASLLFLPFLFSALIAIVVIIFTRYVSLGSIIFGIFIPVFVFIFNYELIYLVFSILLAVLIFYRHKDNISRLLTGTEKKLGRNLK